YRLGPKIALRRIRKPQGTVSGPAMRLRAVFFSSSQQATGQLIPRSFVCVLEVVCSMEQRQIVGLTGAIVLLVGVFTPIVSIPTVGYINYFQNEKLDGMIILSLAILSFVLLLTRLYRTLWFTGFASLGVLLFTFIKLQLRISEIKE